MPEDPPEPEVKTYKCKYCGKQFDALWKYGNHAKNECEEAKKAKAAEREGELSEGLYKGEVEADTNKILKKILEDHPDIKEKHVKEVMSWAEMSGQPLHPSQLVYLLSSMKGIDNKTANMVAQKYSLAINRAMQEGMQSPVAPMLPGLPGQQQPLMPMAGQQQSTMPSIPYWSQPQPYSPQMPPQGFFTQQDIEKLKSSWEEQSRLAKLEDSIKQLKEDLPNIIQKATPQTQAQENFEEVSEYVDANGRLTDPNEAVSVKIIRRPVVRENAEDRAVDRILKYKEIFSGREDLTAEKIRQIVRDERGVKSEKSEADKVLENQLAQANKKLEDMVKQFEEFKDDMDEKEKQRVQSEIGGLRQEISSLRTHITAGGVQTPEGVLATGITELGRREPIKIVIDGVKDLVGPPGIQQPVPQPSAQAEPGARNTILQALGQKGLVTTVRERIRGQQ